MKEKNKPKCKEWERRRREKLNEAFNILAQLLPNYDPAKNLPKIDILERSTEFVKDLRLSNSRLVSHQVETDEKCKLIKELQDEVNKLILRVKQLTALLKTASIPIPSGPFITSLGKKKLKWSGKCQEDNYVLTEKVSDEENSIVSANVEEEEQDRIDAADFASESENAPRPTTTTCSSSPLKEMNGPAQTNVPAATSTSPTGQKKIDASKKSKTSKTVSLKRKALSLAKRNQAKVVKLSATIVSPPTISPPSQPLNNNNNTNCLLPNGTMIPLLTSSPITAVFTEPPKSTTATILPMQTIFLTAPNQINTNMMGTVNNSQPIITRISLGSNQLLSQSLDGRFSNFMQKIPILQIRKAIPKVKWKRKRRKRFEPADLAVPQPSKEVTKITPSVDSQAKNGEDGDTEKGAVSNEGPEKVDKSCNVENNDACLEPKNLENLPNSEPQLVEPTKAFVPPESVIEESFSTNTNELMQIQLFAHEPDNEIMEVDPSLSPLGVPSPARVLCELKSRKASTENDNPNLECSTKSDKISELEPHENGKVTNQSTTEREISVSHKTNNGLPIRNETEVGAPSVISAQEITPKVTFDHEQPMDEPSHNQETISSPNNETVSGDKISECISRSMDLIDAPDEELMELGDTWGDATNSPKSPISPTQMFLSMFPLLPKDNVVPTSEGNQIMTNPRHGGYTSSQAHRSFYIDSMLPDDNSLGTVQQMDRNNKHTNQTTFCPIQYRNLALLETEKPVKATNKHLPNILALTPSTPSKVIPASLIPPPARSETTKTTKSGAGNKSSITTTSTPKSPQDIRRSHSHSGGQQSFKDLHLFSDSVDFNTLHVLPFSGMTDQDLYRGESSRSRVIFDQLFPLNTDLQHNVPSSCNTDHFNLQHLEIQDNTTSQFPLNRDRHVPTEVQTKFQTTFSHIGESYSSNYAPIPIVQTNQTLPKSQSATTIHNLQNSTNSRPHHSSQVDRNTQERLINFGPSYPAPTVSSIPPKTVANVKSFPTPSSQPNVNTSRQLFRPQVHDIIENNQPSLTSVSSPIIQSPKTGSKRTANAVQEQQMNKLVQSNLREIPHIIPEHVDYFSFQKSSQHQVSHTIPKISTSAEKRKGQKKSRNTKDSTPSSNKPFVGSNSSNKERTHKDNSKESPTKKAGVTAKHNIPMCEPMEDFHQFTTSSHQQIRGGSTALSSMVPDIFTPQSHLFGHSTNQQSFEHNVNLNLFPEFSLPVDCNPHYDHYSMEFSLSSSTTNTSQPQQVQIQPHSSSGSLQPHNNNNPPPSNQQYHHSPAVIHNVQSQQPPSNTQSSRPTPFYLQDVNCDYNFEMPSTSSHQSHPQIQPSNISSLPTNNPRSSSSNLQSHHYGNSASGGVHSTPRHQPQQSAININHQHQQQYFQTSSQSQPQHQIQCQPQATSYPANNVPRQPSTSQVINNTGGVGVSNSRNNGQIQQHQPQNPSVEQQLHSHYANAQQTHNASKTKFTPALTSSASHNNNSNNNNNNNNNQPSLSQPSYSSTNPRVLPPPPTSTTSSSSHRPVNWMTDNQIAPSTSSHNPFIGGNNNSTKQLSNNNPTATNPLSISKLVGLAPTNCIAVNANNSHPNNKPQSHAQIRQNTSGSSNYCAEALIRKNPATSTSNQTNLAQIGWQASSSSTPNNKPHNNFFQESPSMHPHRFNVQHQTPNSSQHHENPYNTSFNDNFHGIGYNFHNTAGTHAQNYEPFELSHQHHAHFQHSHNIHHNPHNNDPDPQEGLSHNQGGTSSLSNFNLSTIFPEINDKRQQQRNNPSINASSSSSSGPSSGSIIGGIANSSNNQNRTNSGSGSNNMTNVGGGGNRGNSSNSCGYYGQQPTGHGQGRSK